MDHILYDIVSQALIVGDAREPNHDMLMAVHLFNFGYGNVKFML